MKDRFLDFMKSEEGKKLAMKFGKKIIASTLSNVGSKDKKINQVYYEGNPLFQQKNNSGDGEIKKNILNIIESFIDFDKKK